MKTLLMINSFYKSMSSAKAYTPSIRTQQKRDRLLRLLGVSQEHEAIAKNRFNMYKDLYVKKKEEYLKWCEENEVDAFIE